MTSTLPDSPASSAPAPPALRIIIASENASERWGGEAILPVHYFRRLRARGYDVHLVAHARVRDEIATTFAHDQDRLHFIPEGRLYLFVYHTLGKLPGRGGRMIQYFVQHTMTQLAQRKLLQHLIQHYHIDVVHEPEPVSPKMTSALFNLGAPVVIGPMNGGMTYPPDFTRQAGRFGQLTYTIGRSLGNFLNRLLPGKLQAHTLLVANDRTRNALPSGTRAKVITLVENGVDLSLWKPNPAPPPPSPVEFVFIGRMVDWKCVDVLLEAFVPLAKTGNARLTLIGDGDQRASWEKLRDDLGLHHTARFLGFKPQAQASIILQQSHVLVLPSIYECGGAVVLEAMACGLPVIATNWGGPADYLDPTCCILIPPAPRPDFIQHFTQAMQDLANDPQKRARLGHAARQRVESEFNWDTKIDRILKIYADAVHHQGTKKYAG